MVLQKKKSEHSLMFGTILRKLHIVYLFFPRIG